MPWLSILVALLTFFARKSSGASTGEALATGLLAGGVTYGITHHTDWGKENLGFLDGVEPESPDTIPADVLPSDPGFNDPAVSGTSTGLNTAWYEKFPWETAAVATGVGAAVGSSIPPWLVWGGLGLLAYSLIK